MYDILISRGAIEDIIENCGSTEIKRQIQTNTRQA